MTAHVREPGTYSLITPGTAVARPLTDACLKEGDEVGFVRDEGGRLFAVAGPERLPLEEGKYAWNYYRPNESDPVRDLLNGATAVAMFVPAVVLMGTLALLGLPVVVG